MFTGNSMLRDQRLKARLFYFSQVKENSNIPKSDAIEPDPLSDKAPRSCNCGDCEYRDKYLRLLEEIARAGLDIIKDSPRVAKDRLIAINFLRKRHGRLKVSSHNLHKLRPELKQEVRDYLYIRFRNNPRAKYRIDEVLAKPKKSRARGERGWNYP